MHPALSHAYTWGMPSARCASSCLCSARSGHGGAEGSCREERQRGRRWLAGQAAGVRERTGGPALAEGGSASWAPESLAGSLREKFSEAAVMEIVPAGSDGQGEGARQRRGCVRMEKNVLESRRGRGGPESNWLLHYSILAFVFWLKYYTLQCHIRHLGVWDLICDMKSSVCSSISRSCSTARHVLHCQKG